MKIVETIIELIKNIQLEINFNLVEIVDYWEADLCATGLKRNNKLIYLSTYKYNENSKRGYDFD